MEDTGPGISTEYIENRNKTEKALTDGLRESRPSRWYSLWQTSVDMAHAHGTDLSIPPYPDNPQ